MQKHNSLKKGEVIPLTFDKMFKRVFADPNDTDLVKYLIKQIIGISVDEVTIYNNELLGDNYNSKKQEVDLVLRADEIVVNFKLNSRYNKTIINRNVLYVCRLLSNELVPNEKYLNLSKHYQVNLNINEKRDNPFRIYQFINTEDINDKLTDLISIYEIDISYYMDLWYNKGVLTLSEKEKILALLGMNNINDIKEIVGDDDIMKKIESKVVDYSKDLNLVMMYDKEELERQINEEEKANARAEGIEQGIEQKALSVAKNMLARNMDINLISELTGLSIREIKAIKKADC